MTFKDFINHSRTLQKMFGEYCVRVISNSVCNLETDYQPTISQSAPSVDKVQELAHYVGHKNALLLPRMLCVVCLIVFFVISYEAQVLYP